MEESLRKTMKFNAAKAALAYVQTDQIIGIGSGTTMKIFIDLLASIKHRIAGTVSSSIESTNFLKAMNIPVYDLNTIDELPLYIDSADAFNMARELVKGGGGALTREKILASAAQQFICITDESKKAAVLGEFPVAIEVIPMARSYVARELVKLGGQPRYREHFITDNGNIIIDVHEWQIANPSELEHKINNIAGVVGSGIFADRRADIILIGTYNSVEVIKS